MTIRSIPMISRDRVFPLILISGFLLSGCTSYSPTADMIGISKSELIARLGAPFPSPDFIDSATSLDFPRGPMGKHTYRAYFDNNGLTYSFDQLLTEARFAEIKSGMKSREVVRLIGASKEVYMLGRERGYVWSYRYQNYLCQWFQIEFTNEDLVRSADFGVPPECKPRVMAVRH